MTFLQAIDWMRRLDEFKLHWIEEPTSADDVLGHRIISQVRQSVKTLRRGKINYWQGLRSSGVGVATGECCQNRVLFKQFLMSGGMQFCQVRREETNQRQSQVLSLFLVGANYNFSVLQMVH